MKHTIRVSKRNCSKATIVFENLIHCSFILCIACKDKFNGTFYTYTDYYILERSEIIVSPSSQTVANGETAIFHCNARGSNISVRWIFNGSPCGSDSCEWNGISINRTERVNNNNFMINSTLEISTGELNFVVMESYTIKCIVEQNLVSSSLRGDNITITITLSAYPQELNLGELLMCVLNCSLLEMWCNHNVAK